MQILKSIGRKINIDGQEFALISLFVILFFVLRFTNFDFQFTFIYDQARDATNILEMWRTRKPILIGPPITTFGYQGRQLFIGPATYYFGLIFLVMSNFDPKLATQYFVIFSGLMMYVLYVGVKWLTTKRTALFMLTLYTLLPFYIKSTITLWNPNFQFVLVPLQILTIAYFKERKSIKSIFLVGLVAGFLFQFHYQYVLILVGLLIYYAFIQRQRFQTMLVLLMGMLAGFSPMVIFELRNNFYLTQTVLLFINHFGELRNGKDIPVINDYYLLSTSVFIFLIIANYANRFLTRPILIVIGVFLLIWASNEYIFNPYRLDAVRNWTYEDEMKVFEIIKTNTTSDFNIATYYDTLSNSQKYFLKREGMVIDWNNYNTNKYLYVIYKSDADFHKDSAYEMYTFQPSKTIRTWRINESYSLFLAERM